EQSRDFPVLLFLGETHDLEGRHGQAADVFTQLRALFRGGDAVRDATARVRLAQVLGHLGRTKDALGVLDELVSEPDAERRYGYYYWWAQYHRGIELRRAGRLDDAEAVLEQVRTAERVGDLGIDAEHQRGVLDVERCKWDEAEKTFRECLRLRDARPLN